MDVGDAAWKRRIAEHTPKGGLMRAARRDPLREHAHGDVGSTGEQELQTGVGSTGLRPRLHRPAGMSHRQLCRHRVETQRNRRGIRRHQPPVWLMCRETRPSTS